MKTFRLIGLLLFATAIGAFAITVLAMESAKGRFVFWEFLGKPPGRAVEIIAPGFVLTNSGELFKINSKKNCFSGCWDKAESVSHDQEAYAIPADGCADITPYLGYFRQTKIICELKFASSLTIYGIGMDGFIYFWHFETGEPLSILYSPFLGAALGFSIGVLAILMREPSTWQGNAIVQGK
jgi:hypothetical protein